MLFDAADAALVRGDRRPERGLSCRSVARRVERTPADKHEAIVAVRGIAPGAAPPTAFEFEIYRNGVSVRSGQVPATGGDDHGARALAGDVCARCAGVRPRARRSR